MFLAVTSSSSASSDMSKVFGDPFKKGILMGLRGAWEHLFLPYWYWWVLFFGVAIAARFLTTKRRRRR